MTYPEASAQEVELFIKAASRRYAELGVPPAEADQMGTFARSGNAAMIPTVVAAQTGLTQFGPAVVSSVARTGGQVRLAPGQFKAWANPQDPTPKASSQPLSPEIPTKVV
jgi:hypothetical protein